ncbi:MAG: NAD-dependent epimerase/dehydratase family protein [Syntrophobacteraceae bacterium]
MDLKKNRTVVTGGAGFIGSHLVDRLLGADNEVIVIDDFSCGSMKNLLHHQGNPKLRVERADILDEKAMMEIHRGADVVFHLACRDVRLSLRQPTIVHEVNATGTLNVLKAAAAAKVRRFLYCSSSEVNGAAPDIAPLPEDCHFRPETIYGASKLVGEYYTQVFHRSGWLNTVIARPHNNYGPREHYLGVRGEAIPRFILWALGGRPSVIYGDGKQTRDFTYVTETVDCMVRLVEREETKGRILNICRGEETSIAQIAALISELTGLNVPPVHLSGRPGDILRLWGDTQRLCAALGSGPAISIREGLEMTIDWFRRNITVSEELLNSIQIRNWEIVPEPWLDACEAGKEEPASRS